MVRHYKGTVPVDIEVTKSMVLVKITKIGLLMQNHALFFKDYNLT